MSIKTKARTSVISIHYFNLLLLNYCYLLKIFKDYLLKVQKKKNKEQVKFTNLVTN